LAYNRINTAVYKGWQFWFSAGLEIYLSRKHVGLIIFQRWKTN